jgi:uncharacterized membrane protein YgaE (UPF0421/DUF939 family)
MIAAARRGLAGRDIVQELRLAGKITLAGTLSWWVASALGARLPIFAVLVPLVAMTGDPFSAVSVSVDRVLGIFAGVGLGIGLVHLTLPGTVTVALALAAGMGVGIVLRVGARVNTQAAVSALFMIGVAGSSQAGIARVWETGIGAVLTVLVAALVWPPDPLRELRRRLERLRQGLAVDLAAIAVDLATGSGAAAARLELVRTHSRDAVRDVFELEPARRALRWSPLRRSDLPAVLETEARINLAARLYRHARALARDVADLSVHSETLAAATRHLAGAADDALSGLDAGARLDLADAALAHPADGEAAIVAAQLRQLLADLRPAAGGE